jgi:hypothetical protein
MLLTQPPCYDIQLYIDDDWKATTVRDRAGITLSTIAKVYGSYVLQNLGDIDDMGKTEGCAADTSYRMEHAIVEGDV